MLFLVGVWALDHFQDAWRMQPQFLFIGALGLLLAYFLLGGAQAAFAIFWKAFRQELQRKPVNLAQTTPPPTG